MTVKILYFAALREALGLPGEELELLPGITSVGELRSQLAKRGPPWLALETMKNLRVAVNQTMAAAETAVANGDEVAFFPPVTGG
jgi:molybdopterin synthase sulfur carrier subunit